MNTKKTNIERPTSNIELNTKRSEPLPLEINAGPLIWHLIDFSETIVPTAEKGPADGFGGSSEIDGNELGASLYGPGLEVGTGLVPARPEGERLYSFRLGEGFQALAYREGNWLRLLSLHPDHDSAYGKE